MQPARRSQVAFACLGWAWLLGLLEWALLTRAGAGLPAAEIGHALAAIVVVYGVLGLAVAGLWSARRAGVEPALAALVGMVAAGFVASRLPWNHAAWLAALGLGLGVRGPWLWIARRFPRLAGGEVGLGLASAVVAALLAIAWRAAPGGPTSWLAAAGAAAALALPIVRGLRGGAVAGIVVASALGALLAAWVPAVRIEATPPEAAPGVLLVTIDTLRADRLGAYGHTAARTPNLDALAKRGVRFEQAITPARFTGPAHASILTGLLPESHGVRWNGSRLAAPVPTLSDVLGSRGWVTGAFVSGWTTRDRSCGLPSRFQEYDEDFLTDRIVPESLEWVTPFSLFVKWQARRGVDLEPVRRSAEDVTDRAVRWLERNGDRPFFVWVHYFDPHLPYEPPDRYRSDATRRYRGVATGRWYDLDKAERTELVRDPESVSQMGRLYDAAISAVDDALGRLLATAQERAPGGRLLTVVVADHGESMGEHALWWERDLYDPTLRVPWILASMPPDPGLRSVVPEQVRAIDVAPTVLELLGLEPPSPLDGRSAVPLMRGEPTEPPRMALSRQRPERSEHIPPAYAVREDGWKLIQRSEGWKGPVWARASVELYELRSDPGELDDVSQAHAARVARMRREAGPEGSDASPAAELPEDVREQLRRLGYLE